MGEWGRPLESVDLKMSIINQDFWRGKSVFITGHTGFKGSWLSLWLMHLGAKVSGYSLPPPNTENIFDLLNLAPSLHNNYFNDVRDLGKLTNAIAESNPEIIFHLAAQPLVRESYEDPVETYSTNIMGTVNVLEAFRQRETPQVAIIVTTDKCYENKEWIWGYREIDQLGGHDPYSSSKSCAELVSAAYRKSFFSPKLSQNHHKSVSTVRAGNVIGGGDRTLGRLVPDLIQSIKSSQPIILRNPDAVRPWQHVLEPLCGYIHLAEKMYISGHQYSGAWNFAPNPSDMICVRDIAQILLSKMSNSTIIEVGDINQLFHETKVLKLDYSKARGELGWNPRWDIRKALDAIVDWENISNYQSNMSAFTLSQINEFMRQEL